MSIAKVVNHGPSALCLRADLPSGSVELDLEVGATYVDEQLLAGVLDVNAFADEVFSKQCTLELESERSPAAGKGDFHGQRVTDLSLLTEAAALKAIEACDSAPQLRAWVLTDARPAVKKALHLRDRVLRPAEINEAKVQRTD